MNEAERSLGALLVTLDNTEARRAAVIDFVRRDNERRHAKAMRIALQVVFVTLGAGAAGWVLGWAVFLVWTATE